MTVKMTCLIHTVKIPFVCFKSKTSVYIYIAKCLISCFSFTLLNNHHTVTPDEHSGQGIPCHAREGGGAGFESQISHGC